MSRRIEVGDDQLASWCDQWLGAPPKLELFTSGYMSVVKGLVLADGREVVVKVRPTAQRIRACVEVQCHMWSNGFPCPELLTDPHPLGLLTATAETFISVGEPLKYDARSASLHAEAPAEFIRLAPSVASVPTLEPPPA